MFILYSVWSKNRIFASGQALAFSELMRRIRPLQEVNAVRDEVKVRKIERLSGTTANVSNIVTITSKSFVENPLAFFQVKPIQSEQLYLYQTKKKLEERLEQLKIRVNSQKQQYRKLAMSCKENSTYFDLYINFLSW